MFIDDILKVLVSQTGWATLGYLLFQVVNIFILPNIKYRLISLLPLPFFILAVIATYQMWQVNSNIWPVPMLVVGNYGFAMEIIILFVFIVIQISNFIKKKKGQMPPPTDR